MYSLVVKSSGFQPRGGAPPKGQKMNLRGCEMIIEREECRKNKVLLHKFVFIFLDFSLVFVFCRKLDKLSFWSSNNDLNEATLQL